MSAPPVSIIILTHNEELSIGGCLDSVVDFGDVHVLDSGSTDHTLEIVQKRGIPIHHHRFEGFGRQRNWAIDNIPTRHSWHFHLDADERFTAELSSEIERTLATGGPFGGYYVANKLMFGNRWLRYSGGYPTYQVRLFHLQRLRFIDHGHGQREETQYPLGKLVNPYLHFAFSKGLDAWFAKHAVYARREAAQVWGCDAENGKESLFSSDAVRRRRALKRLSSRLPARYVLRLLYMLTVKRAFLDGRPGLIYAHMLATYEGMMDVYASLLKHRITP